MSTHLWVTWNLIPFNSTLQLDGPNSSPTFLAQGRLNSQLSCKLALEKPSSFQTVDRALSGRPPQKRETVELVRTPYAGLFQISVVVQFDRNYLPPESASDRRLWVGQ
uniref:Uncharacterized protein n=1 Tax=Photinus pyralis TaxID=7054 RepID=A0A1Y1L7E6_PHOPY